ncbi:MAG TPA: M20/M25/M40 family metallo-hydrolase [bacterium]|nr:M20/M25/M40 family metallo-hydrolase [bacterium]
MPKWLRISVFLACISIAPLRAQDVDPGITRVIAEVNPDSLIATVGRLSGETPVWIRGGETIILSRNKNHPGNDLAAEYIAERLSRMGLEVENHWFSETGRNVLGFQAGGLYPGQVYLLSAHYDSMPDSAVSPGADDNASGVAAVLEAARILAGAELNFSVIYAFWDEEEYGYIGSRAYAVRAVSRKEDIRGVINLDMIGWDGNGDMRILLDIGRNADRNPLFDTANHVNGAYGIGLTIATDTGTVQSDQRPFRNHGFLALGIHEYLPGDMNPFYHTVNDRVEHLHPDFFLRCARLAAGTIASLAQSGLMVAVETIPPDRAVLTLAQNHPNPFNPETVIAYTIPEPGHVVLDMWDMLGRQVSTLVDGWRMAGPHAVTVDGRHLPSGMYTYRIQMDGWMRQRKMLLLK